MSETTENIPAPRAAQEQDDCYRCGYALHTIPDDLACPECGLLARRSRRVTDDLHRTRPRWLRRITLGVVLLLLAVVLMCALPLTGSSLARVSDAYLTGRRWRWLAVFVPLSPMSLAVLLLFAGTRLLTSREGYAPADAVDRRRRVWLRALAAVTVFGFVVVNVQLYTNFHGLVLPDGTDSAMDIVQLLCALGVVPFPLLLFMQLRSLARRVRSAHLAEHCAIVGCGLSGTLLGFVLLVILSHYAAWFGLRRGSIDRMPGGMALIVGLMVSFALFGIWSIYLLVRFGIAFLRASRALRREWRGDDRSIAPADAAT